MDFFETLRGGTVLGKRKQIAVLENRTAGHPGNDKLTSLGVKEETTKKPKIRLSGHTDAGSEELSSFDDGRVADWLRQAVFASGYSDPTDIQRQAFPIINSGYDLVASAATGSGKTLGFLLPMLSVLEKPGKEFARGLVVACTRELAQQIVREANHLIANCSKKFRIRIIDNLASNVKRIDIAISTPLRLVQLINDGSVSLADTQIAVFDEADKLLDLGFSQQVDEIVSNCMKERDSRPFQLCFFSATLPSKIVTLAKTVMRNPVTVTIGIQGAACANIQQSLVFVGSEEGKIISFKQLVSNGQLVPPALVFVNSKEKAKQLCSELLLRGILADSIHADRSKAERDRCVKAFREGKIWVLVATDVLARGLDFKAVEMVINYDMPTTAVSYIHRIGRTGRAGRKGKAVTFFTSDDKAHLRTIANVIKSSGQDVPEWISKVPRRPSRFTPPNRHSA